MSIASSESFMFTPELSGFSLIQPDDEMSKKLGETERMQDLAGRENEWMPFIFIYA